MEPQSEARRTPSTSPPRNYVYKHVYIYFSAAGQFMAVGSLESGNLMVYGPLQIGFGFGLRDLHSTYRDHGFTDQLNVNKQ